MTLTACGAQLDELGGESNTDQKQEQARKNELLVAAILLDVQAVGKIWSLN